MTTVVLVGNPKPRSRTLQAACRVAGRLTGAPPDIVVDVVELADGLLGRDDRRVAPAVAAVRGATLLVVASPTFKASYTGLLKLFLDQLPPAGLSGVVAVPMMLGAAPTHALAPELLLKPVLVELGALCPTRALYLLETQYDRDDALGTWLTEARAHLGRTSPAHDPKETEVRP